MKKIFLFFLIICTYTFCRANDTIQIKYGQYVQQSIDPSGEVDIYYFPGKAGEHIILRVNAVSNGEFESHVELESPSGVIDTVKWDTYNVSYQSDIQQIQLIDYVLKETGNYTIYVSEHDGAQTSTYWLSLQCREQILFVADTLKLINGSIDYSLSNFGKIKAFLFLVNQADTTEFSISRSAGSIQPTCQLYYKGSVISSSYNSNAVTISDTCFKQSGEYVLFISDYNGDETGTFKMNWKGVTLSVVTISEILSHKDVYNLNVIVNPIAVIQNIGWESIVAEIRLKILDVYSDGINNITLLPGQSDTITMKQWTPEPEGLYAGNWSTHTQTGAGSSEYSEKLLVTDNKGPEIHAISPETGVNGGDYIISIDGKSFKTGIKAVLFNKDYPAGRTAENSDITFISSDKIEATFDLSNVPESKFSIKVINPDDSAFICYDCFTVTEFGGKELELNKWEEIEIAAGTQQVYGINITTGTPNLFFLVKKATKIGHHGTWTGGMRVFRQGTLIAEESGMQDYDFHFKNMKPGRYYIEVWSKQDATAQIRVSDHVDILKLGEWHEGIVLKGWGNDWTQVDVPANTEKLYFETQGFGKYSNLHIYYDSIGNPQNHYYFDSYQTGYHLKDSIQKPVAGRYYLKYMDSDNVEGGESQERDYLINVDVKPVFEPLSIIPVITGLSTYEVGQGKVTIEIQGEGLSDVKNIFVKKEENLFYAENLKRDSILHSVISDFNFTEADTGYYKLFLTTTNDDTASVSRHIHISCSDNRNLWIEILGSDKIRIGRKSKYIVKYKNLDIVNNEDAYLIIKVPSIIEVELNLNETELFSFKPDENIADQDRILILKLKTLLPLKEYELDLMLRTSSNQPFSLNVDITDTIGYYLNDYYLNLINKFETLAEKKGSYDSFFNDINCSPEPDHIYPPGEILYWVTKDYWHIAKSVGNGKYIDLLKDGVQIRCLNKENLPHNAIFYHRTPLPIVNGDESPEEHERKILERAQKVYNNRDKFIYEDVLNFCDENSQKITTNCLGLFHILNPEYITKYNVTYPFEENEFFKWIDWIMSHFRDPYKCWKGPLNDKEKKIEPVGSSTPEDKYGSIGYGVKGYTSNDYAHSYKIDFWNHENATANAQEVFIKDTLDTGFDDETLNFTGFGFLRWKIPLKGGQYFNVNIDMRPDMNLRVNVEGKYYPESREISWIFRSLDPVTFDYPEDPLAGFLPPIDTTGYQIGWVEYEVKPNINLPDGTELANRAWVNFDRVGPTNPAPKDAPWTNTIDNIPPVSYVDGLPPVINNDSVLVSWLGTDAGSGIRNYNIYISENNSEYNIWLNNIDKESQYFRGENGKTYYFYSIAKDNVGLLEKPNSTYDEMVRFEYTTVISDIIGKNPEGEILIYPNPTEGYFTVVSSLNCSLVKIIEVFNSLGEKVLNKQFVNDEIRIDLADRTKGLYFIKVTCGNSSIYGRIVTY